MIVANHSNNELQEVEQLIDSLEIAFDDLKCSEEAKNPTDRIDYLWQVFDELSLWSERPKCGNCLVAWSAKNITQGWAGVVLFGLTDFDSTLSQMRPPLEVAYGRLLRQRDFLTHFLSQIEDIQV